MKILEFFRELRAGAVAVSTLQKAQKLILEYEQTQNPHLLDEMRKIKPLCQVAVRALTSLQGRKSRVIEEKNLAMAYRMLGGISLYLEEYSEAWDIYSEAKRVAEETENIEELAGAINNMGLLALNQGDYEVALELFREAETYLSRLPSNSTLIPYLRNNIQKAKKMLREKNK